jgi:type II secretory pathway pseudopilin PulG
MTTRSGEGGFTLVALMAAVTVMLIMMAAAVPSWRYVMKNDREEELIARGGEIADAIARYQARNGNALPPSLEVLVKGKYLRREYKDPMTKDGRWRFIRQGEAIGPIRAPGGSTAAGGGTTPTPTTTTTTRPSAFSQTTGGTTVGGIQGVASTSKEEGLRVFNGRTKYNEWVFLPGQPRIVGRPPRTPGVPGAPGAPGAPGQPGVSPAPGGPARPAPLTGPGVRR